GPSADGRGHGAFLDATLEPLLEVCEAHRAAVAAVEVANEPGWAARASGEGSRFGPHPPWVSAHAVGELVVEGARRIARRDLRATVGFVDARPTWLAPTARTTLRRLADRGAYVHQRHHYPRPTRDRPAPRLPPADGSPIRPIWVGELATSRARRWPDPGLAEDDDDRYLERRIERVRSLGYEAALVWAVRATDAQVRWDETTRAQLARVAAGRRTE
ncbi:MAG TPA: hypothetical protein RMH99_07645, partial [Sandaracinaceae bacterium LLY-WYZ-13_1]|nr:hypothetical protein [Sandaracinaceae bacterium LLY-WYZ-13_1]